MKLDFDQKSNMVAKDYLRVALKKIIGLPLNIIADLLL